MFARRANPRVDREIVRKSMSYLESQVESGLADWVNSGNHREGIIARELLNLGPRTFYPLPENPPSPARVELPGIYFKPPASDPRPSMQSVREAWDWSAELLTSPLLNSVSI